MWTTKAFRLSGLSHGWVKRYDRLLQNRLFECEMLCAPAMRLAGAPNPAAELDAIWKETMLYQSHDVIPGSSIKRVYDECFARAEIMLRDLESLIESAARALAGHAVAGASPDSPVMVFNPLAQPRTEWVRLGRTWRCVTVPGLRYCVVSGQDTHPAASMPEPTTAASHSFVGIDASNVCVSPPKKAEDGDATILRLNENAGRRTRTNIRFGFPVQRVERVNLMEEQGQTLRFESGGCVLDFAPFEIVTLKLT